MTTPGFTSAGFDDRFLGVEVGLPAPVEPLPVVLLGYAHFSVLLRPDRRLAAVIGVGIDGATLLDLDRADIDWAYDRRVQPHPLNPMSGPLRTPPGRSTPMAKTSFTALAREQLILARAAPAGRSARTVHGGHEHALRQTLIALLAG